MPRLFTFGCSFTQYMWPTWADIIAYDMGIEYYNFAIAGLGNVGIQHRILEADLKHNFTDDDIVLILWTSWCREDRVKDHQWIATGSVLNTLNDVYDRKFVKKYWDYSNDVVKNSTAIISANEMYKKNIKWQGTGSPFFMLEYETKLQSFHDKSLIKIYKNRLPTVDFLNTFVQQNDPLPFKFVDDCHPDVVKHMSFVKDFVYPKLNLKLQDSTISRFTDLQNALEQKLTKQIELSKFSVIVKDVLSKDFSDIQQIMNFNSLLG
jgi:hypothetical protein